MAAEIAGIGSKALGAPRSDATHGSNALGKDEFLKLLMAQLSSQDPLSPVDSQAFVAQLAQFSNLEQLQQVNERLETLLISQASMQQTALVDLVGRDVLYRSDGMRFDGAAPVPLSAQLASDATNVTVAIVDSGGRTVRTLTLGAQPTGEARVEWDGRDDHGNLVPAGDYTARWGADADGKSVSVEPRGQGRVSGIGFEGGSTQLLVDGRPVLLAEVLRVLEPTGP